MAVWLNLKTSRIIWILSLYRGLRSPFINHCFTCHLHIIILSNLGNLSNKKLGLLSIILFKERTIQMYIIYISSRHRSKILMKYNSFRSETVMNIFTYRLTNFWIISRSILCIYGLCCNNSQICIRFLLFREKIDSKYAINWIKYKIWCIVWWIYICKFY